MTNYKEAVEQLTYDITKLSIKQFDDTNCRRFLKRAIKNFELTEEEQTKLEQYFYVITDLRVDMRNKFIERVDATLVELDKTSNMTHSLYIKYIIDIMYSANKNFYDIILTKGLDKTLKDIEHSNKLRSYRGINVYRDSALCIIKRTFQNFTSCINIIEHMMKCELTDEQ